MALNPDATEALSDLRELVALGADDLDTLKLFQRFADEGLPLFCVDGDISSTEAAGCGVFSYKLADELKVRLTTLRVRARNLDTIEAGNGHSSLQS